MNPKSRKHCINYEVVFKEQGIKLTPADVEETKQSTSRALQVLLKYMMLDSLFWGQQIIPKSILKYLQVGEDSSDEDYYDSLELKNSAKSYSIPDLNTLSEKNWQQLRTLTVEEIVLENDKDEKKSLKVILSDG